MTRFGDFDDAARDYVISCPDTPLPWINYLGSESFFGLISHMGSGYSFYRDARLRRLTRYRYNSVPNEQGGHYWLEIMIPGSIVGLIVGYATQTFGRTRAESRA